MTQETNENEHTNISPVITIETKIGRVTEGVGSTHPYITSYDNVIEKLKLERETDQSHQRSINNEFILNFEDVSKKLKHVKDEFKKDIGITSTYFESKITNLDNRTLDTHNEHTDFSNKTQEDLNLLWQAVNSQNDVIKHEIKVLRWTSVIAYSSFIGLLLLSFFS